MFRQLWRSPGFSAVAVLTLALGIGASTAIFTVVSGVLLKPLPYPQAERIMRIYHVNDAGATARLSDPDFADLDERSKAFASLAQFGAGITSVVGGREPVRAQRARVSGEFFRVIGMQPMLGRTFTPQELQPDGAAVIVSGRFWERHLGAPSDLSGLTLRIDERDHPVVGVMPHGFDFPAHADFWTPLVSRGTSRTAHNSHAIGRLADGTNASQAAAELAAIGRALRAEHGENSTLAWIGATELQTHMVAALRPLLLLLLGAAGLLLLIAWANVASMLLARAVARQREFAVRIAVGAGRARLARQLLQEASLYAGLGGALGLVVAAGLVQLVVAMQPPGVPRMESVGIDGTALVFTVAISLLAGGGLGLLVALRAIRDGAANANRQLEASTRAGKRAGAMLVTGQVALALVLMIGAGLLLRSFAILMQVSPGLEGRNTLVASVSLPAPQNDAEHARVAAFHQALLEEIEALPEVRSAALINLLPMADGRWNGTFLELAHPREVTDMESFSAVSRIAGRAGLADYRLVSNRYFETLRIPLLTGRVLDTRDQPGAQHAAVISESLSRAQWGEADPLGKLIQFGNMDGILEPLTVVGVVGDVHESGLAEPPSPTLYAHYRQRRAPTQASYVIHARGAPLELVPQVRRLVAALDPEIPPAFTTMEEVLSASVAQRRFALALVGAFGIAALSLALVGLYGAMAFSVSQRTREIGLRMAIGARTGQVARMIVREGLSFVAIGILLGLGAALVLSRFAGSLVYGISSKDPATYIAGPLLLLAAAACAAWLPARRAARVDPNITLKHE